MQTEVEQLRNDLRAARYALEQATTDQGRMAAEALILDLIDMLADAVTAQSVAA